MVSNVILKRLKITFVIGLGTLQLALKFANAMRKEHLTLQLYNHHPVLQHHTIIENLLNLIKFVKRNKPIDHQCQSTRNDLYVHLKLGIRIGRRARVFWEKLARFNVNVSISKTRRSIPSTWSFQKPTSRPV